MRKPNRFAPLLSSVTGFITEKKLWLIPTFILVGLAVFTAYFHFLVPPIYSSSVAVATVQDLGEYKFEVVALSESHHMAELLEQSVRHTEAAAKTIEEKELDVAPTNFIKKVWAEKADSTVLVYITMHSGTRANLQGVLLSYTENLIEVLGPTLGMDAVHILNEPSEPIRVMRTDGILIWGSVFGLLFGLLFVALAHMNDRKIKTATQLDKYNLPIIGVIPTAPQRSEEVAQ